MVADQPTELRVKIAKTAQVWWEARINYYSAQFQSTVAVDATPEDSTLNLTPDQYRHVSSQISR
jgi:hypothetical protein